MMHSKWRRGKSVCLGFFLGFLVLGVSPVMGADGPDKEGGKEAHRLTLVEAVMCEKIVNQTPVNPSAVFPVGVNNAYCYTTFQEIPEKTVIWHRWYRKDILVTKIRLVIEPPRWSTFSGITLRETDKGPWRVEITDKDGKLFSVKRFSISD